MSSELHHVAKFVPEQRVPNPMDFKVGIVGAGKLGTTLALALAERGILSWIVVRNQERKRDLRVAFSESVVTIVDSFENIHSVPDVIICAVPDSQISSVAIGLAKHFVSDLEQAHVVHCSGAIGVDVLSACENFGASTAALHPFQTFAYPSTRALQGIGWGIECNPDDQAFARWFVMLLNGTPVFLSDFAKEHKALYHASAVASGNAVQVVVALAGELIEAAQVESRPFVPHITRTAAENALTQLAHGGSSVLTGPIARADVATIVKHLEELKLTNQGTQRQYCYISLATNEKALQDRLITAEQYQTIKQILEQHLEKVNV